MPTSKGKRSVRLYSVKVDSLGSTIWADDIAPAVTVGDQAMAYDALKGYMSVDLATSSVRKTVLENGLEAAQALQAAQKKLGYDKYFKVKVEYFAWEPIPTLTPRNSACRSMPALPLWTAMSPIWTRKLISTSTWPAPVAQGPQQDLCLTY